MKNSPSLVGRYVLWSYLVTLFLAPELLAQEFRPNIWRVSDEDSHFYLLGSIHVLRESDYPLKEIYTTAFEQVDAVAFEVNLNDVDIEALANIVVSKATYSNGKTIIDDISQSTYNRLQTYLNSKGYQIVDSLKPWFHLSLTAQIELEGFTGVDGVDRHFFNLATQSEKPIFALETPAEQIGIVSDALADVPVSEVEESLIQFLDNRDSVASGINDLIDAWSSGNLNAVEELLALDSSDSNSLILDLRNLNWMPALKGYLHSNQKTLVTVGAAHLGGENGLLQLLADEGFSLEALPRAPWMETEYALEGDRIEVTIRGNMGRQCTLQYLDNEREWRDSTTFTLTDEHTNLSIDLSELSSPRLYRTVLGPN